MEIQRAETLTAKAGSAEWFTGAVQVKALFTAADPALVAGAHVTFEPGARTVWHTHPLGQTLLVTSGKGWVQREGGAVEEVERGDVVSFAPGEKHWHGATATSEMSHVAVQERVEGKYVEWMEPVTEVQYRR